MNKKNYRLLLFFVYFIYGLVLLYIKPYFTFLKNPDEYYHWRQSLLFLNSFHISNNYPFLVHVIGGLCFWPSGPLLFRFVLLIISLLALFLFYILIKGILNENIAIWSGITYIFLYNSDFYHLFGIGTFANIIGDFFSLLSAYIYYRCYVNESRKNLFLLGIVSFLCYFSHILTIIVLSFLALHSVCKRKKMFVPIVLGLLIAFIMFPNIFLRIRGYSHTWEERTKPIRVIFIQEKCFDLASVIDKVLPAWLKPINILMPLYSWTTYILFPGIYLFYRQKNKKVFLYYFLWIIFVAYGLYLLNGLVNIWRISLYAYPIKAFFMGFALAYIVKFIQGKLSNDRYGKLAYRSIVFLILFLIFYSSVSVPDLVYGVVYTHKRQIGVYDSFTWIRNHYPESKILSIAIKEYRFLPIIANVTYLGDYSPNYDQLTEFCKNMSCDLIAIFTWEYRYPLIKNNPKFKEVYNNNIVAVFRFLSNFDG